MKTRPRGLFDIVNYLRGPVFAFSPGLDSPTIPAKAGIQINASWIPAFAGMIGVVCVVIRAGRMEQG